MKLRYKIANGILIFLALAIFSLGLVLSQGSATGVVGLSVGTIPGGYGFPPLLSLILGVIILVAVLRYFGRKVES